MEKQRSRKKGERQRDRNRRECDKAGGKGKLARQRKGRKEGDKETDPPPSGRTREEGEGAISQGASTPHPPFKSS